MIYPLFKDMDAKLKNDLDLNEETFVTDTERKGYWNEAVAMIQHQIITLAEDYMLASLPVATTVGQTDVQLPANIYANKIRKIQWTLNQSEKYEILPIRNLNDIPYIEDNDAYQYLLVNNGVTNVNTIGTIVKLYPACRVVSTAAFNFWYIRAASTYIDDTSVCDVPEWSNVLIQYVRYKCMNKEGHPGAMNEKADLETLVNNMNEALRSRTMDENTELALDSRTLAGYADFQNDPLDYWY